MRGPKGQGGGRVLGEGAASPSPPATGSGERYKLLQWPLVILVLFEPQNACGDNNV